MGATQPEQLLKEFLDAAKMHLNVMPGNAYDDGSNAAWTEVKRLAEFRLRSVALLVLPCELTEALRAAIKIADEARDEWDKAPGGMRAGKLLIALSGRLPGYRPDIDAIHATIAKAESA